MRMTLLLVLLAACATEEPPSAAARRRIALGLDDAPLPLKRAMKKLEPFEEAIDRGRVTLDDALRIENLLQRAQPRDDPGFAEALDEARVLARDLVDGGGAALQAACADCHARFREDG